MQLSVLKKAGVFYIRHLQLNEVNMQKYLKDGILIPFWFRHILVRTQPWFQ